MFDLDENETFGAAEYVLFYQNPRRQ